MGYLLQSASGIANSSQVTISFWAKVIAPTEYFDILTYSPIMSWGVDAGVVGSSVISWVKYPDDPRPTILLYVTGPTAAGSYTLIFDPGGPPDYWREPDGSPSANYIAFVSGATTFETSGQAMFAGGGGVGSWFHCLLSIDTGHDSIVELDSSVTSCPLFRICLNGVDCTPTISGIKGAAPGGVSNSVTGHSAVETTLSVGASTIGFSGRPLGIPSFPGSSDLSITSESTAFPVNNTQLADFMMWTGLFLNDPISAYSNFVVYVDGQGVPAPISTAVAAYGAPKILLSGGSNRFLTNQGTGGPFTKTGTIIKATGISFG